MAAELSAALPSSVGSHDQARVFAGLDMDGCGRQVGCGLLNIVESAFTDTNAKRPRCGDQMDQLVNVIVGLATALIGYVVGRVWQRAVDWLRYRRARIFLGPAIRGGVQVVPSRFSVTEFHEPTGVVGGGEALALRELATFFAAIGLKNIDTVFVDEGRLNARGNLILLGGLDTNRVTMAAMELLKPNVTIVDPGPGIPMEVHDLGADVGSPNGGETSSTRREYKAIPGEVDYGVIIRAPNPFDTSKAMIIIAGAYGHGVWAGIDLIQQSEFLRKCEELDLQHVERVRAKGKLGTALRRVKIALRESRSNRDWSGIECIFKVGVFDNRPTAPEILVIRSLPRALAATAGSSAPPTKKGPPAADAARQ
jgi:hypothetical protein